MARIPSTLPMGAARTQPPATRMPQTGDLGLGALARSLQGVAEARERTVQMEADTALKGVEAGWSEGFKPAAEAYDGREPGFAGGQMATWDVLADGARSVLSPDAQRAFDLMAADRRIRVFDSATTVEASAAGGRLREARAIDEEGRAQRAFTAAVVDYEGRKTTALETVSPDDPSPADGLLADWDADLEARIEAAPVDIQPRLRQLAENFRANEWLKLQAADSALREGKLLTGASEQLNLLTGGVTSNPDSYGAAIERLPGALAALPRDLEAKVRPKAEQALATARIDGLLQSGRAGEARALLDGGGMDAQLGGDVKADYYRRIEMGEKAWRSEAERDFADLVNAIEYGGDYDIAELQRLAAASGNPALIAQAGMLASLPEETRRMLQDSGRSRLVGARSGPGFEVVGADGQPLGTFSPPVRGAVSSGFGPRRAPTPGASEDHNGIDYAVPEGTPVAAVAPGRVVAVASDGASGKFIRVEHPNGMVSGYAHLSTQDVAVGDEVRPGQVIGKSGNTGRSTGPHLHFTLQEKLADGKLRWVDPSRAFAAPGSAAYVAFANTQEGFTSDPLEFARGGKNRGPLVQVPVLIPDSALSQDPAARAAWGAALKGRQAIGAGLAQRYQVPERLLTNAEAKYYGSLIEADPTQAVVLARRASEALGPQGAMRLLREAGQTADAPLQVHLATLAAIGNPDFAARAAQGLQLKGQGVKLEPGDTTDLDRALVARRPALTGAPDVLMTARRVAEAAWLADRARGVDRDAADYLEMALGRTKADGRTYGGTANYLGRRTLLPEWLNPDYADDAMRALGELWEERGVGPVYPNGKAYSAREIAGRIPVMTGEGRYRLMTGNGDYVRGRDGRPFEFDPDGTRRFLRERLGREAVR